MNYILSDSVLGLYNNPNTVYRTLIKEIHNESIDHWPR